MRDYKKEYREYQGKPEQIKRRAGRNAARRHMMKLGHVKKGDGKDVHHRDNNPKNNSGKNLAATSVSKNRGFPRTAGNKPKKGLSKLAERTEALIKLADRCGLIELARGERIGKMVDHMLKVRGADPKNHNHLKRVAGWAREHKLANIPRPEGSRKMMRRWEQVEKEATKRATMEEILWRKSKKKS